MYNPDEIQNDENQEYNTNNAGFGDNLIHEGNNQFENEQGQEQSQHPFPIHPIHDSTNDNSFQLGKRIDDFSRTENFNAKEKEIIQQITKILDKKSGLKALFTNHIFLINKILLLTTFSEFLFQRFDAVTLFLCIAIIFIELDIFQKKHLYKWLLVLINSLLLDAFVLIDISPVSKIFNNNIIIIFLGWRTLY